MTEEDHAAAIGSGFAIVGCGRPRPMIPDETPWLLGSPDPDTRPMRLFCLPFAGGSAAAYAPWRAIADRRIAVAPVQLPGRGARIRERPLADLDALARSLARALLPFLDRPYAFFGHSMGALLGFETLRLLRELGAPMPLALFVSARRAPHLPGRRPPLYRLSDADLLVQLRDLNGTPAAVLDDPELLDLLLPVVRADLTAVETHPHRAGQPFRFPIQAFGGARDGIPPDDLRAWADHTADFAGLTLYPGDHFYLVEHRAALVNEIGAAMLRFGGGA